MENKGTVQDLDANSFQEFWPIYLRAHSKSKTRMMHYAGTVTGFIVAVVLIAYLWSSFGVLSLPLGFIAGLFSTYLFAIPSHAFFEGNRAATLESLKKGGTQGYKEVWWSILGDLRMTFCAFTGQLDRELERFDISE